MPMPKMATAKNRWLPMLTAPIASALTRPDHHGVDQPHRHPAELGRRHRPGEAEHRRQLGAQAGANGMETGGHAGATIVDACRIPPPASLPRERLRERGRVQGGGRGRVRYTDLLAMSTPHRPPRPPPDLPRSRKRSRGRDRLTAVQISRSSDRGRRLRDRTASRSRRGAGRRWARTGWGGRRRAASRCDRAAQDRGSHCAAARER